MRRTDRHVDAGDLVLTLDDGALILGTLLLEVDAFVGGGADRVVGLHAKAGLELGDANRLEPLDQHPALSLLDGDRQQAARGFGGEVAARVRSRGAHRRDVQLGGFRLAAFEFVADRLVKQLLVVPRDADRCAQGNRVAHDDVLARLTTLPHLLEGLFQDLEEGDRVEVDVVASELSGVDFQVGVVDDAAAARHLVDMTGMAGIVLALGGVAKQGLLIQRHQHVDLVDMGMDRHRGRRDPVVAVLAHDVRVELDVGEDVEATVA